MRYVVGLGNPGQQYETSRHNLGFRVVDELARRRKVRLDREVCGALIGADEVVQLVKPLTYMNRSGYAVRCLVERSGEEAADLLIVYDEVNLDLGRLRMRPGGDPAGHRGMESIVENLRTTAVPRLRLGVGDEATGELADYVLSPFTTEEEVVVERMVDRAADAAECWLTQDVETAMNEFNGPVSDGA